MERERRSEDPMHARRWRRKPYAPARVDRPRGGPGRAGDGEPRKPDPQGGGASAAERPPSAD
jgi:hypothetical protein